MGGHTRLPLWMGADGGAGDHHYHLLRDNRVPLRGAGRPTRRHLRLGTGEHFPRLHPGAHRRGAVGSAHRLLVGTGGVRACLSVAGSALAALALFGLARANTLWQFYLLSSGGLRLAMALTLYPVTFTVVANWFVRKRGKALAVLTLVGGLSSPICTCHRRGATGHRTAPTCLLAAAAPGGPRPLPRWGSCSLHTSPCAAAGATFSDALGNTVFWMLTASISLVMLGTLWYSFTRSPS